MNITLLFYWILHVWILGATGGSVAHNTPKGTETRKDSSHERDGEGKKEEEIKRWV